MAKDQDIILAKIQAARLGLLKKEEWMVRVNNHWSGPYELEQLHGDVPLRPETLVKRLGDESIVVAAEDPALKKLFTPAGQVPHEIFCPRCHRELKQDSAGGQPIHECVNCGGILVAPEPLRMILHGRKIYDKKIVETAAMLEEPQRLTISNNGEIELKGAYAYVCPYCKNLHEKMRRRFYGNQMLVEIDECLTCQRIWLDKDELEILQYLSDQQKRNIAVS